MGVLTSNNERKLICEIDDWVLGGRAIWGAGVGAVWELLVIFPIIDDRVLGHAVWGLVQVPFRGAVWGAAWVLVTARARVCEIEGLVLGGQVIVRAHFARLTVGC